jgi:uncharacterized protein (TIGR03435 family)
MRSTIVAAWLVAGTGALVLAQAPATPQVPQSAGPTFDVVSIKRNTSNALMPEQSDRPDGGFRYVNVPVRLLIARAFPSMAIEGAPGWTLSERYDVSATSTIPMPTREQRAAMIRALLSDRFRFAAHVQTREQPAYDLVMARGDRRLGAGLTPIDADCDAAVAAQLEAAATAPSPRPQPPDLAAPPAPCTLRTLDASIRNRRGDGQGAPGGLMEGEASMAVLASGLRMSAGRIVVDKTGLKGSYRIRMNFDSLAALRGLSAKPGADAAPDSGPSVFVALPEQLGLKLEASRTPVETVVIDRIERPTEN